MIKVLFVVLLLVVLAMTFYGGMIYGMAMKTSKILGMLERHGWRFIPPDEDATDGED